MVAPDCTPSNVSAVTFPIEFPLKFLQQTTHVHMTNKSDQIIYKMYIQWKQRDRLKQVVWNLSQVVIWQIPIWENKSWHEHHPGYRPFMYLTYNWNNSMFVEKLPSSIESMRFPDRSLNGSVKQCVSWISFNSQSLQADKSLEISCSDWSDEVCA